MRRLWVYGPSQGLKENATIVLSDSDENHVPLDVGGFGCIAIRFSLRNYASFD